MFKWFKSLEKEIKVRVIIATVAVVLAIGTLAGYIIYKNNEHKVKITDSSISEGNW